MNEEEIIKFLYDHLKHTNPEKPKPILYKNNKTGMYEISEADMKHLVEEFRFLEQEAYHILRLRYAKRLVVLPPLPFDIPSDDKKVNNLTLTKNNQIESFGNKNIKTEPGGYLFPDKNGTYHMGTDNKRIEESDKYWRAWYEWSEECKKLGFVVEYKIIAQLTGHQIDRVRKVMAGMSGKSNKPRKVKPRENTF